jgi:hypothetical protein
MREVLSFSAQNGQKSPALASAYTKGRRIIIEQLLPLCDQRRCRLVIVLPLASRLDDELDAHRSFASGLEHFPKSSGQSRTAARVRRLPKPTR